MDFDSRLSTLTSVALNQEVKRDSRLWINYKHAKQIRNKVTHLGRKVTFDEAKSVVDTVYEWLEVLGSHAEVDLSIIGLKKYIEMANISFRNEDETLQIVIDYFSRTRAASGSINEKVRTGNNLKYADLVLKFGNNTVIIEMKIIKGNLDRYENSKRMAVHHLKSLLPHGNYSRGVIIFFYANKFPESYATYETIEDGSISIIGIESNIFFDLVR